MEAGISDTDVPLWFLALQSTPLLGSGDSTYTQNRKLFLRAHLREYKLHGRVRDSID
jgi:hypothetical protein